ncbi:MAG: hypothetical protein K2O32_03540 [Acetatifactor sp.]|nr:hypothetical protein [Acetatifactor sp.]
MAKVKKILIAILIMILIPVLIKILYYLYFFVFFYPLEHIKVNFIASYELDGDMDDIGYGFYDDYRVSDLKVMIEEENWKRIFGELEGLSEKLDTLDDDTKIVISRGREIKYLWMPKKEYTGYIGIKYRGKKTQNKIYFYTTEYKGAITVEPIGYSMLR